MAHRISRHRSEDNVMFRRVEDADDGRSTVRRAFNSVETPCVCRGVCTTPPADESEEGLKLVPGVTWSLQQGQ